MAKPEWLTIKPVSTAEYGHVKDTIQSLGLHTVCAEAHCPNVAECWGGGTATFMVLGEKCTRGCRFCAIHKNAKGAPVDSKEPEKLAYAIKQWGLSYVVITSVCRDDLPDQGASHFAECIRRIKAASPTTLVEVLIPDFGGDSTLLQKIVQARPDVVGHNIETVERLSPSIRDRRASYRQSLSVLSTVKRLDPSRKTKSAIMLGIGESSDEVLRSMDDLRSANVDFVAIGQYLSPGSTYLQVKEYVTPEKFEYFKIEALKRGFSYAASGPFVRSSYRAGEYFISAALHGNPIPHAVSSAEVPHI